MSENRVTRGHGVDIPPPRKNKLLTIVEENERLLTTIKMLNDVNIDFQAENAKLKEALKYCLPYVKKCNICIAEICEECPDTCENGKKYMELKALEGGE